MGYLWPPVLTHRDTLHPSLAAQHAAEATDARNWVEAALYKLLISEEQQVLPANAKVRGLSLRHE